MNSLSVFGTVLISCLFLTVVGQGSEFCQRFLANGNKIDFAYQHYPYDHEFFHFWYLIIGDVYWRVKYDIDLDTIHFTSTTGQKINLEGQKYSAAIICQACLKNETVSTGFLKKNENKIVWIDLDHNKKTGELKSSNQVVKEDPIDLESGFSPNIGFDFSPNGFIFLKTWNGMSGRRPWKKTFRGYGFNSTLKKFENDTDHWIEGLKTWMDHLKIPYGADNTILNEVPEKYNLMAIFNPPFSVLYNPFMVILLEDNKELHYCFANEKLIQKGCNTTRHPIRMLVDCKNPGAGAPNGK